MSSSISTTWSTISPSCAGGASYKRGAPHPGGTYAHYLSNTCENRRSTAGPPAAPPNLLVQVVTVIKTHNELLVVCRKQSCYDCRQYDAKLLFSVKIILLLKQPMNHSFCSTQDDHCMNEEHLFYHGLSCFPQFHKIEYNMVRRKCCCGFC